jgi:hypothetical protein
MRRNMGEVFGAGSTKWYSFRGRTQAMLSNLFTAKDIDEFADSLVEDLLRRFPPSGLKGDDKSATKRISKTHRALFSRIEAFARSHDLTIYRKARLGNRVKWGLKEAGYKDMFVEAFTYELVTVLAVAGRNTAKVAR